MIIHMFRSALSNLIQIVLGRTVLQSELWLCTVGLCFLSFFMWKHQQYFMPMRIILCLFMLKIHLFYPSVNRVFLIKTRERMRGPVESLNLAKNELTNLGVPICKFLKHVGVSPLILFVMFLNLILANSNLSTSCSVWGISVQNVLKVCHGQTELIAMETSLPAAVQSLLIVLIQLNNLSHRHAATGLTQIQSILGHNYSWIQWNGPISGSSKITLLQFSTACENSFIRR